MCLDITIIFGPILSDVWETCRYHSLTGRRPRLSRSEAHYLASVYNVAPFSQAVYLYDQPCSLPPGRCMRSLQAAPAALTSTRMHHIPGRGPSRPAASLFPQLQRVHRSTAHDFLETRPRHPAIEHEHNQFDIPHHERVTQMPCVSLSMCSHSKASCGVTWHRQSRLSSAARGAGPEYTSKLKTVQIWCAAHLASAMMTAVCCSGCRWRCAAASTSAGVTASIAALYRNR
jgi:hypothetical protein